MKKAISRIKAFIYKLINLRNQIEIWKRNTERLQDITGLKHMRNVVIENKEVVAEDENS
jgi:hypothetical protein